MIAAQSFGSARAPRAVSGALAGHIPSRPPQAHYKNAEGVLSFSLGLAHNAYPRYQSFILLGLDAEGVAQSRYLGTSASQPALVFQFKTKNSKLTISPKIGKVMQGNASVSTPPGGGPFYRPRPPVWERKIPYFQPFYPCSNPSIHIVFNPKKHAIFGVLAPVPAGQQKSKKHSK
jgi:hypothetical protein